MFHNPSVEIYIPHGSEEEACDSLLLMQLQAVPNEKVRGKFCQEYTVSVPLDGVESVVEDCGVYRVSVRSSQNLFNEIMLRGAVGASYSIRMFSTSSMHLQSSTCMSRLSGSTRASSLHSRHFASQGIPRVFVVANNQPRAAQRTFRMSLSHSCIVSSVIGHSESPLPLHFRPTMQASALAELKNQIADRIAEVMAAVLRVRHARLQRLTLLDIADYIMPQLFQNHGWVQQSSATCIDVSDNTTAIVLNAHGFPAFALCRK